MAAMIPTNESASALASKREKKQNKTKKLTKQTKLGLLNMRTLLQTHHLRMIRGQERSNVVSIAWINVMVHPRLGHVRDGPPRDARPYDRIDIRLVGLA